MPKDRLIRDHYIKHGPIQTVDQKSNTVFKQYGLAIRSPWAELKTHTVPVVLLLFTTVIHRSLKTLETVLDYRSEEPRTALIPLMFHPLPSSQGGVRSGMSMDRHTLQAVLEEQERHRDGVERRREEQNAQRDADRTAHMTAMADKMAAMCLAIQNLVVAQAQGSSVLSVFVESVCAQGSIVLSVFVESVCAQGSSVLSVFVESVCMHRAPVCSRCSWSLCVCTGLQCVRGVCGCTDWPCLPACLHRYIHSMNRTRLPFQLAVNPLSDRTAQELASLRGRKGRKTPNKGLPFPHEHYQSVLLPESIDWRLYGAVTPVKDQTICVSCWSYATTGALEGTLFLKTGSQLVLSQQMLVDCTWGFGNNGCDGGEEWRTYEWVMKHGGITTAESYRPYLGQNGFCHYNQSQLSAKVKSYTNVTSGDLEALKLDIFKNGPVAVSIDAAHKSFLFYSSWVYYEPQCGNTVNDLDHAVLAVGYGVLKGEPYWLVKNSWSTYWGNDGYVLMSMKDNNCGVATDATYVTLE
ncbi:UNVERIFIED_CONTAM: hypothetical protein FKN15_006172 [Acipenser sinensis]